VAGYCDQSNESSGPIKCEEILAGKLAPQEGLCSVEIYMDTER
jgi:hypothetical protein